MKWEKKKSENIMMGFYKDWNCWKTIFGIKKISVQRKSRDQEKSLQEQISLEKRIMDELKVGCLLIHIEEECQRQFFSIRSAKGKRNRIGKFRNVLYDWRNMEMSVV